MMYKEILELANSNRIFIKNYDGQISEFNFAVCSKIAYDSLIADSSREYVYSTALNQLNEILEDKNSFRRFSFLVDFNDPEKTKFDYSDVFDLVLNKKTKNRENIINKIKFVLDFIVFQRLLNNMEINILPISGYRQDYQNETGRSYLKLVQEVALKLDVLIKEKYD